MLREELHRLMHWEERHRRLLARLLLVLVGTVVIDLAGALVVWRTETHLKGTDIHGLGDAFFFATVQVLTVSSSVKNPLSATGKVVDILLELWAVVAVAGSAGAIATFFQSGDG
jgi:hypothetical protein